MNSHKNLYAVCLCAYATITVSALAETTDIARSYLAEDPAMSARTWQGQVSKIWADDTFEAKNAATNVIAAIKAIKDVAERRRMVSEYAGLILKLDVKNEYSNINSAYRRRFLFNDALDLLDGSEDGIYAKWNLWLDYCCRLKDESEWLRNVSGTNLTSGSFVITGEVVVVSSPEVAKTLGPPCQFQDFKRPGYKNPNIDSKYRSRRTARLQTAYAKFLLEMLDEEEREHGGDVFKRDCDRLPQDKRQKLIRRKERVFGKK